MKKQHFWGLGLLCGLLLWILSINQSQKSPGLSAALEDIPAAATAVVPPSARLPAASEAPDLNKVYSPTFAGHVPTGPAKWEHQITQVDDKYVGTQLKLNGKNVDTYFYRWKKVNENGIELVAGLVPSPKGVKGKFPNAAERERFIDAHKKEGRTIASSEDVWTIGYDNYLHPRIKLNVEFVLNGNFRHEYWYLDSQGQIVKVRSLDRR